MSFTKKLSILLTGTGLAQLISIFFVYILTFYYSPLDYKNYTVFVGIVTIVGGLITLKYELAIPLAKKTDDAISIVYLAFMITAVLSGIIFTISILVTIFFFSNLIIYVVIGSATIFFVGVYNTLLHWALREEAFKDISVSRISQSTVGGVIHTILGFIGYTKYGLPIGNFFNFNAGTLRLFRIFHSKKTQLNLSICKRNLFYLKKYPLYSTLESFFMNLSQHASIILMGVLFGVKAGIFMLCMRIMSAPVGLIGENLKSLYLSEIGKKTENEEIKELTRIVINKSIYFGSLPIIIISIVGYFYADYFFPESWSGIGYYIVFIAPWMNLSLVSKPFSVYFNYENRQEVNFFFNIILFSLGALTLILGYIYKFSNTIEIFCILNFIIYLVYYLITSLMLKITNKIFLIISFFQFLFTILVLIK